MKEIESENLCQQKYEERLKDEDFGETTYGRIRKYFWNLTEYPETSRAAQVYAFISLFVVILSTVTFVLSTTPQLAPEMDLILFDIEDENSTDTKAVERWDEVSLSEKYWLRMHLYVQQTTFHCSKYMTV